MTLQIFTIYSFPQQICFLACSFRPWHQNSNDNFVIGSLARSCTQQTFCKHFWLFVDSDNLLRSVCSLSWWLPIFPFLALLFCRLFRHISCSLTLFKNFAITNINCNSANKKFSLDHEHNTSARSLLIHRLDPYWNDHSENLSSCPYQKKM